MWLYTSLKQDDNNDILLGLQKNITLMFHSADHGNLDRSSDWTPVDIGSCGEASISEPFSFLAIAYT